MVNNVSFEGIARGSMKQSGSDEKTAAHPLGYAIAARSFF
jgi:hypothetical protein